MVKTNEKQTITLDEAKIRYERCSSVDDRFIFQAFQVGFSDYIVKFEFTKEDFLNRFFGPEGNEKENSFIAFYEEEPVGIILGGIKNYETIKTMRCGTLAISPDYRGSGISQKLFELHKTEAKKHGCKQLFLEVIGGNERAIHFYKKMGYEKIYDIVYFSNDDLSKLKNVSKSMEFEIKKIDLAIFKKRIHQWNYHINWQNDIDFLEKEKNNTYYGAFQQNDLVGCLSVHTNGTIRFLMVDKEYRNNGIGTQLLQTAYKNLRLRRLSSGFPNNSLLEGFFKKHGFTKGSLAQYEMYCLI